MKIKQALTASTLAAGIGAAGLLGVGLATAGADPWCGPGAPCWGPHNDHRDDRGGWQRGVDWHQDRDGWRDDRGRDWYHRGIDDGRFDLASGRTRFMGQATGSSMTATFSGAECQRNFTFRRRAARQ